MKMIRIIAGFVPLLWLMQACAPAYVPNVVPSPGLREKGDLSLSAHYGNAGLDLQGAYGLTDHLGVMINGSFDKRTYNTNDSHRHEFLEAGLGYFATEYKYLNWSVFAGFGGGNFKSYYHSGYITEYNYVNVDRYFFQPSMGIFFKYFEGDLAFRLAFLNFNGYRNNLNNYEKYTGFYPMLEPVVTLKFGPEHLKFFFQSGLSFNLKNNDYLIYNPIILSLGIRLRFNMGSNH